MISATISQRSDQTIYLTLCCFTQLTASVWEGLATVYYFELQHVLYQPFIKGRFMFLSPSVWYVELVIVVVTKPHYWRLSLHLPLSCSVSSLCLVFSYSSASSSNNDACNESSLFATEEKLGALEILQPGRPEWISVYCSACGENIITQLLSQSSTFMKSGCLCHFR